MKKLVLGIFSIGMIFLSSCASDDESDKDGGTGNLDPASVTAESLNGTWEIITFRNDLGESLKKGETFDYFEGDNYPDKPYSKDQIIQNKIAFLEGKQYSNFKRSEQIYLYDDK